MKPNILLIPLLMTLFTFTNCEKWENEINPAEAILGKWEMVEIGNWPNMSQYPEPSGYREYLPDSIMREYNYESGEFYYQKYSIDTLLYEIVSIPDGPQLVVTYTYQFLDKRNKLRLDYFNIAASFNTHIFKRIN
jgi:hypothetical protein